MRESDTLKLMAVLKEVYPTPPIEEGTLNAYATFLRPYEAEHVARAVRTLVVRSKFLPRISEIVDLVAEQSLGLPQPVEAWRLANEYAFYRPTGGEECHRCAGSRFDDHAAGTVCARCHGTGWEPTEKPTLNPVVRAALDYVGGPAALREAELVSVLRAQFRSAYLELRGEVIAKAIETSDFDAAAALERVGVASIQRRAELTDGGER